MPATDRLFFWDGGAGAGGFFAGTVRLGALLFRSSSGFCGGEWSHAWARVRCGRLWASGFGDPAAAFHGSSGEAAARQVRGYRPTCASAFAARPRRVPSPHVQLATVAGQPRGHFPPAGADSCFWHKATSASRIHHATCVQTARICSPNQPGREGAMAVVHNLSSLHHRMFGRCWVRRLLFVPHGRPPLERTLVQPGSRA